MLGILVQHTLQARGALLWTPGEAAAVGLACLCAWHGIGHVHHGNLPLSPMDDFTTVPTRLGFDHPGRDIQSWRVCSQAHMCLERNTIASVNWKVLPTVAATALAFRAAAHSG